MERLYTENKKIKFYDCDENGNLNVRTYLSWCAEIAGDHLVSRGILREELLEKRQVFLLSQVALRVIRPLKYHEECVFHTWEMPLKGVKFMRHFALLDKNGEECYHSTSAWILVDPVDRKILRPSQYGFEVLPVDREVSVQLTRLRTPEMPQTAEFIVPASKIDGNGHMGNQFYTDLLRDFAPLDMTGKIFKEVELSYNHEARQGERLYIHTDAVSEDGFSMYGEFEDGHRSFEASVKIG